MKKVGALATPQQKISRENENQKRKGKSLEDPFSKSIHATSATQATHQATISRGLTLPSSGSVIQATPAMVASASQATFTALTQAMAIDKPELQQIRRSMVNPERRLFTPPPIEVREKETPTKGRKRMAKDDDAWTPTDGEILSFVIDNRICTSCWCTGHAFTSCKRVPGKRCPSNKEVFESEGFRPFLAAWKEERRKRISARPDAELGTIVLPQYCNLCFSTEHDEDSCDELSH